MATISTPAVVPALASTPVLSLSGTDFKPRAAMLVAIPVAPIIPATSSGGGPKYYWS